MKKKPIIVFLIKAMKVTIVQLIILIMATCVSLANDVEAQVLDTKINISVFEGQVVQLLDQIQNQADVKFIYSPAAIDGNREVSINISNKKLGDVLLEVLNPIGVDYKLINNRILLYKSKPTAAVPLLEKKTLDKFSSMVQAMVTGTVKNEEGDPMPGVNIVIRNKSVGTTSDIDGKFKLQVANPNDTLVFSFIGYLTEEFPLKGRSTVDIALTPDIQQLNELVVVGYGTQQKKEITSAVANVEAKDFNQGGARSPLDLVQGKVAGLTITRTGGNNPNSGASIQLRGITSLTGDTQPLIVINGIPGGNLDLLQQDDIESISVLKDGSAAAIYGSRANAGVILVTTKKGKEGPARFEYSTYFSRDFLNKKPDFLDAEEYRALMNNPNNTKAGSMTDYGYSTDFYDLLLNKDNLSQYHNLALSGGNGSTSYRASVFYNDFNGIAQRNSRNNYGARLNIVQTGFDDRLTGVVNLATNFNKADLLGGGGFDEAGVSFESALTRNPTQAVYNEDGTFWEDPTTTNELAKLAQNSYLRSQQTTSADAKFTLDIVQGLKASVFGSFQRDNYIDNFYSDVDSKESTNGDYTQYPGRARKQYSLFNDYAFEPTLEYNTTFGEGHVLGAIAGYSYRYHVEENFYAQNRGFLNDVFEENNLDAGNAISDGKANMDSYKADNTLIAFFGRVNYSFKDKYLFQFVLRHEGSSKFGTNYKWGDFPAVSGGWDIKQEGFMQDVSVMNTFKLRAGYGVTGNSGIDPYQSIVTLSTGNYYIYPDGVWRQTYGPSRNPNPDLRWEKKKELNIGLDFGFLNSRLAGSIDVYQRRTVDLLETYNTQLPPFVRSDIYTNVGTIENNGVEIVLSAIPVTNQDFTWNIDFTASTQSNKLESFSNDLYEIEYKEYGDINGYGALGRAIRTVEGGNLGEFYGKRFAGFTEDGQWMFYKADGSTATGDQISDEDKTVIGNAIPKYYASWTNTFRYKNFDLTVFFRGKFGYDILNTMQLSYGNPTTIPTNVLQDAVDNLGTLNDTYQYSDYYLEKGNFVKLDNVTLAYNFNFKTPLINKLRVYATGRNLLTITKYSGVDPEIEDTGLGPGIDARGGYPRTKTFTVGLNLGF